MTQDQIVQNNHSHKQTKQPFSIGIRMLIGAAIGLFAISFFIFGADGKVEWGEYWRIRPLIITPLTAALGAACTYALDRLQIQYGWNRTIILILNLIGFLISLWLGTILGLAGTMWD